VRRLIINADDFGLTSGVNSAIIECHQAGTVTSATLMANSKSFDDAVRLARTNARLGVGCHVMLVDGEPLLPVKEATSLLASGTKVFRSSAAEFARAAIQKQLKPDEIAAEASAQFHKLRDAGIAITHFDTHKHTHMFPAVLKPLLQAANASGIRAVRNPFGLLDTALNAEWLQAPQLLLRRMQMKLLNRYATRFSRAVKDAGMKSPDGTLGILATGSLHLNTFRRILDAMPQGTWEFVCHPGYNDAALDQVKTKLRASRMVERQILTMPQLSDEIKERGIELISFADL
jgi:predicted glycoside hydrolase/deacetylase ChbG (UPF0249 family)